MGWGLLRLAFGGRSKAAGGGALQAAPLVSLLMSSLFSPRPALQRAAAVSGGQRGAAGAQLQPYAEHAGRQQQQQCTGLWPAPCSSPGSLMPQGSKRIIIACAKPGFRHALRIRLGSVSTCAGAVPGRLVDGDTRRLGDVFGLPCRMLPNLPLDPWARPCSPTTRRSLWTRTPRSLCRGSPARTAPSTRSRCDREGAWVGISGGVWGGGLAYCENLCVLVNLQT